MISTTTKQTIYSAPVNDWPESAELKSQSSNFNRDPVMHLQAKPTEVSMFSRNWSLARRPKLATTEPNAGQSTGNKTVDLEENQSLPDKPPAYSKASQLLLSDLREMGFEGVKRLLSEAPDNRTEAPKNGGCYESYTDEIRTNKSVVNGIEIMNPEKELHRAVVLMHTLGSQSPPIVEPKVQNRFVNLISGNLTNDAPEGDELTNVSATNVACQLLTVGTKYGWAKQDFSQCDANMVVYEGKRFYLHPMDQSGIGWHVVADPAASNAAKHLKLGDNLKELGTVPWTFNALMLSGVKRNNSTCKLAYNLYNVMTGQHSYNGAVIHNHYSPLFIDEVVDTLEHVERVTESEVPLNEFFIVKPNPQRQRKRPQTEAEKRTKRPEARSAIVKTAEIEEKEVEQDKKQKVTAYLNRIREKYNKRADLFVKKHNGGNPNEYIPVMNSLVKASLILGPSSVMQYIHNDDFKSLLNVVCKKADCTVTVDEISEFLTSPTRDLANKIMAPAIKMISQDDKKQKWATEFLDEMMPLHNHQMSEWFTTDAAEVDLGYNITANSWLYTKAERLNKERYITNGNVCWKDKTYERRVARKITYIHNICVATNLWIIFLMMLCPAVTGQSFSHYGNFCGPGWCNGVFADEATCYLHIQERFRYDPNIQQAAGRIPYNDPLDDCCMEHDICCGGGNRSTCNKSILDCLWMWRRSKEDYTSTEQYAYFSMYAFFHATPTICGGIWSRDIEQNETTTTEDTIGSLESTTTQEPIGDPWCALNQPPNFSWRPTVQDRCAEILFQCPIVFYKHTELDFNFTSVMIGWLAHNNTQLVVNNVSGWEEVRAYMHNKSMHMLNGNPMERKELDAVAVTNNNNMPAGSLNGAVPYVWSSYNIVYAPGGAAQTINIIGPPGGSFSTIQGSNLGNYSQNPRAMGHLIIQDITLEQEVEVLELADYIVKLAEQFDPRGEGVNRNMANALATSRYGGLILQLLTQKKQIKLPSMQTPYLKYFHYMLTYSYLVDGSKQYGNDWESLENRGYLSNPLPDLNIRETVLAGDGADAVGFVTRDALGLGAVAAGVAYAARGDFQELGFPFPTPGGRTFTIAAAEQSLLDYVDITTDIFIPSDIWFTSDNTAATIAAFVALFGEYPLKRLCGYSAQMLAGTLAGLAFSRGATIPNWNLNYIDGIKNMRFIVPSINATGPATIREVKSPGNIIIFDINGANPIGIAGGTNIVVGQTGVVPNVVDVYWFMRYTPYATLVTEMSRVVQKLISITGTAQQYYSAFEKAVFVGFHKLPAIENSLYPAQRAGASLHETLILQGAAYDDSYLYAQASDPMSRRFNDAILGWPTNATLNVQIPAPFASNARAMALLVPTLQTQTPTCVLLSYNAIAIGAFRPAKAQPEYPSWLTFNSFEIFGRMRAMAIAWCCAFDYFYCRVGFPALMYNTPPGVAALDSISNSLTSIFYPNNVEPLDFNGVSIVNKLNKTYTKVYPYYMCDYYAPPFASARKARIVSVCHYNGAMLARETCGHRYPRYVMSQYLIINPKDPFFSLGESNNLSFSWATNERVEMVQVFVGGVRTGYHYVAQAGKTRPDSVVNTSMDFHNTDSWFMYCWLMSLPQGNNLGAEIQLPIVYSNKVYVTTPQEIANNAFPIVYAPRALHYGVQMRGNATTAQNMLKMQRINDGMYQNLFMIDGATAALLMKNYDDSSGTDFWNNYIRHFTIPVNNLANGTRGLWDAESGTYIKMANVKDIKVIPSVIRRNAVAGVDTARQVQGGRVTDVTTQVDDVLQQDEKKAGPYSLPDVQQAEQNND